MRRLATLLVLVLLASFARADAGLDARLDAAAEAFARASAVEGIDARKQSYAEAARLHEAALATGHANGALEYNTANAWFLAGDLGRAILHYRRALLLRPADARIEANLATARGRRRDQLDDAGGRAVLETVFFWHRGLSLRAKVTGGLVAWALAFALLVPWWFRRRNDGPARTARRAAILLLVAAVGLGLSAVVEGLEGSSRDAAVVVDEEIPLRKGDGFGYPARYENPVHSGAEVRIVEDRGQWLHVELPDGKSGWVPRTALERV